MTRRPPSRPPAAPPADAAQGAALVRDFVVKLYDRQDGEGVNKRMITETLFRAAFDALDGLPDEVCRSVASRVHEGAYERVTNGPKDDPSASKTDPVGSVPAPSNTAVFKSTAPRPLKVGH